MNTYLIIVLIFTSIFLNGCTFVKERFGTTNTQKPVQNQQEQSQQEQNERNTIPINPQHS